MINLWKKKEYLAIGIVILLFILISVISVSSIQSLQGNARVVNYVGIVRGATQKLIKEEIVGWYLVQTDTSRSVTDTLDWYPNDNLIARLDSIIDELFTGEGPDGLVVLQDEHYLSNLRLVQAHWTELKQLIAEVRTGVEPDVLFESSQVYFDLVNDTAFSAESYSENQVSRINTILIFVNSVFIFLIVAGLLLYWRSLSAKRRMDALGKIAYIDPLTQLDNRTSCERLIKQFSLSPSDGDVAVFMFDMNDLKLTNDFLGHQGGDKVLGAFGLVLKQAAREYGFIGRYGGDEFLAIFENGSKSVAEAFLGKVRKQVDEYNEGQINKLEKIHYAVGYSIGNPRLLDIEDIIHEADHCMYIDKHRLKSAP